MTRFKTLDLRGVKTYSVGDRASRVEPAAFARPVAASASFETFWNSLPDFLAARDLRQLALHMVAAHGRHPIIWMMGAHPLKVGLSPVLVDLVRRGFVSLLASHGAFAVHDCEIALFGRTSEDVDDTLSDGRFGMAKETADFILGTIRHAAEKGLGLGEALGEALIRENAPHSQSSLLVQCLQAEVPLTLHVAIGTDIIHEHPGLSGSALGDASYRDFLIFCETVSRLTDGGTVLNVGSAVIMPEVFLKAVAVARNLGHPCGGFFAANFDMIQHYRPTQNVLRRPTLGGGNAFAFTGHHEIMLPLLAAALAHLSSPD